MSRFIFRIIYLSLITIMILSNVLLAHNNTIKGSIIVKNGKSEPVVGATVRVENTMIGTIADVNGKFTLKQVPDGKFIISITAIGYKTLHRPIELKHKEGDDIVTIDLEMEEADVKTPPVVVTATRTEKIYDDIPIKVSVIDDKIFAATSSSSLRDGLSFQPGLRVENNCQNCGFSEIRMNGLEGKYSQVLIDGKAIYSSLNGVYGLEQIPTNMIDRIEVIRGGGSALYGGNAIAGVVNVITKSPSINLFNASFSNQMIDGIKPDNTLQLNSAIVNDNQDVGLYLFGMSRERSEWDANGDGFSEIGKLILKTFGGNVYYKPSYLSKISFQYNAIHHEIRGGNKLDLPPHQTDITEKAQHNTQMFQLQYEQYIGGATDKFSAYASGQITSRESYYGSAQDQNAYGATDNNTAAIGVQYSKAIENVWGNHVFIAGYEFNYDWMKDLAPAYNRTIDQLTRAHGFYLQDDWMLTEEVNFIFGARVTDHNLIDEMIFTPRASVLFKFIDNLSLRGNFSTGYRSPQAFDEDLHITQVGGAGMVIRVADGLKPEYSYSYGASTDYSFKIASLPFALSVEYFDTKLTDVFVLTELGHDEKGNLIMERNNGDDARVWGSSIELMSEISTAIKLKGGVTIQQGTYDNPVQWSSGNKELGIAGQYADKILKTPDVYGFFTADIDPSEHVCLNLSGVITGPMNVPHYAGGIGTDGLENKIDVMKVSETFFELNAKLSYKFFGSPAIELSVGILNIFDSFQKDFDSGIGRDAGYMYGPCRPRTYTVSINTDL